MIDPKEQKKGGFGAFAQRDRERREAEASKEMPGADTAASPPPSASDAGTGTSPGTPGKP